MSDAYAEAWAARRDLDPVVDRFDPVPGCGRRLTLVVDLESGPAREALDAAARDLDRFDALRRLPPAWFHVTVKGVGLVGDDPTAERDLTPEAAERVERRIDDAVAGADIEPFEVALPRLNVWPTVVFCEAREAGDSRDEGTLARLHRRVLDLPEVPRGEFDGAAYTPHVSLAHFVGDDPNDVAAAVDWLEANRTVDAGRLRVERLRLVADDPSSPERRFETVREYPL
ncbi:2'-5' RNA ligase family protein [Halobium salinum]|uniref:2'-5' RNA ligase family protein n=1 Tax=Halobium salinum TaxID=1364940 RepID=A0ABD5PDM9_9EURY|nr:2'-5' RNA ligase family protein [Halobium salinum]